MRSPWHGVELRHLAALTAVGAEGSFSGAADRLGYVQSAVSQQISQFESLVGTRLIDRERGRATVALTDAGEVLLGHAERVIAQLGAARADLDSLAEPAAATLRVGAARSVAARVLPATLALLHRRHPKLRVEVVERPGDGEFFERLERGELDLAFADLPVPPRAFAVRELLADPCVLVVAADARGEGATEPVTLSEVSAMQLVGHRGWRYGELIEAQFRARGLELSYSSSAHTDAATQALVAGGGAAAIMPRLAVATDDPATEVLALEPALRPRKLALCWHRDRRHGEALDAFREAAVDACARRFAPAIVNGDGPRVLAAA